MSEDLKQTAINTTIVNTKNILYELDECLSNYRNSISRIEVHEKEGQPKINLCEKEQEFDLMTLTQKIRYIEHRGSAVLKQFIELNKRFNELV